ncbi:SUMO-activating enzyme subunit 1 [Neocloeon triangulifer]|uniref:SUMO-activating enzyme subunit 1 n=1 Tax=Neocloeon triangulifer TaxID=2078957 RepID=UPI00286EE570|nr:SUMO-activating enzyme subunit 1 [Neocloeon triangulifer]
MVEHKTQEISEDEATLYDRQIRLWGLDSQKRLRAARVLVVGARGLGAEVAKNLILAGVKTLTLLDSEPVAPEDLESQFLVSESAVGTNRALSSLDRARPLNPMVDVQARGNAIDAEPDEFFTKFEVVLALGCLKKHNQRLDQICRLNNIKFFAADVFGFYGYMFADLLLHEFSIETKINIKGAPPVSQMTKETATFVPYQDFMDADWKSDDQAKKLKRMSFGYFLMRVVQEFREKEKRYPSRSEEDLKTLLSLRDSLLPELGVDPAKIPEEVFNNTTGQLGATCAILGGIVAQEVIKAISLKDRPLNNAFFFDPDTCAGKVECIGC